MYGAPPTSYDNLSLSLGYGSEAPGTWSIAIGNNILVATKASSLCNVAVSSQNLQNLTTGGFNTAIGQNSSTKITTGSNNVTVGYDAGGGAYGFVTGNNNIAIGSSTGNRPNITVPVAEGMVLNISLGAVTPPGTTVAYGTSVEINGPPPW